jgi:midasin
LFHSSYTANIHGVFLLKQEPAPERVSTLVMTDGAIESLRQLALHISLRFPVLLTSPPSSGKSLLLSHLAGVLHPSVANQIIAIHLADTSLDPRSLLGSYTSSPTKPGTFEWKEGVLVRAMKQGKWIILQDIDRGSNEVLGVLKPLIESLGPQHWIGACAALDVPSQGRVVASKNFAVFATRSVAPNRDGSYPKATFFGAHKFHEVVNPPPTQEELRVIINSRFPSLAGAPALAILRLWESVRSLEGTASASARVIGARDLEKLCARLQRFIPRSPQAMEVDIDIASIKLSTIVTNPALREEIYLEARDVLFGSGILTAAARQHTERVAFIVGESLDLALERQSWILQSRIPELDFEKDVNGRTLALRVGRNRLPATPAKEVIVSNSRPFAMHKPAISLISRLANSITFNEPILLTGETGTGKTSVVTYLASVLRKPLVSVNLSQQTESSDLLGGFKPVDARIPGSELQTRFTQLFGATFSRKKNAKFEESIRKAVLEWKWKRAVALWLEAIRLAKDRLRAKSREAEPMYVVKYCKLFVLIFFLQ